MTRGWMLVATLCLAAAAAHAQPRGDAGGLLDQSPPRQSPPRQSPPRQSPPLSASPAARWSPPLVALIVDPWREGAGRRAAVRAKAAPELPAWDLNHVVDPWRGPEAPPALRRPRRDAPDFGLVEIVDPWANRRTPVASAAFPPEGVVDPWMRLFKTPGNHTPR